MKRKRAKVHEPYMKFKGWLRTNDIKYEDIAMLLGLTTGTVSDKINGLSDFLLYETATIVKEYGTSYDVFLN